MRGVSRVRRRHLVELVFIGLVVGMFVTSAGIAGSGPAASPTSVGALVSYNPAPLNRFHAPLSSPGILGAMANGPDYLALVPSNTNGAAGPTTNTDPGMADVSVNALRFIQDQSYIPQSETTVGVLSSGGTTYVLSGVNDARYFFCPALPAADCPSGWTFSLSGFSLGTAATPSTPSLLMSDDIPGILYHSTVNPTYLGFLVSWGDPSVAASPDGTFYFASLAIDPATGNNGVMLAKSNAQLLSNPSSCVTPQAMPWMNPCWNTKFVFGSLTGFLSGGKAHSVPPTFEDKELIAVDNNPSSTTYGDAYMSWDHFNADGTSFSYLARCDESLLCTMLAGGMLPPLSGSDPFAAFTTPAVAPNGAVYVTWCNFGTFTTLGPISCRVRGSPAGGMAFGPTTDILSFDGAGTTFPNDLGLSGFATEQFRTVDIPSLAAFGSPSASGTGSNSLYFVIDACTSRDYYGFFDPAIPGNCGTSGILYARSTDGGSTFGTPTTLADGSVNVQPWVTVDPSNGNVSVVYYTTQYDPFNHRIDVVSQYSTDGGATFTLYRVTSVSDEPNADPEMYDYTVASGFGGSFLVPQFGDYFQAVSMNGNLYVVFTGNYVSELGTLQADPFLAIVPGPGA